MREAEVTAIARNLSRKGTTGLPQVIHVQFVEPYRRTLHERPLLGHARNGLVLDGNLRLFGSTARMLSLSSEEHAHNPNAVNARAV